MKPLMSLVAAGGMILSATGVGWGQDKVVLKFADWLPQSHIIVVNGAKPFMEKVAELSGGKLEIEYFPSEQLGKAKDALALLQTGVADIANISPSYIPDKFSLPSVAELPGMYEAPCQGGAALAMLSGDDGVIGQREFRPNGVRPLVANVGGVYKVFTVGRPVRKAEDFSGLKLRTTGGAMDLAVSKLGGASVRMPGTDILPSMSRGTLDGTLLSIHSIKPFDLQTVVKYVTTDVRLGGFASYFAISDRAWDSLSEENRKVLRDAAEFAMKNQCNFVQGDEPKILEELAASGVESITMDEGELAKVDAALANVHTDWAKSLDARGRPGTETLEAYKSALETFRDAGSQ